MKKNKQDKVLQPHIIGTEKQSKKMGILALIIILLLGIPAIFALFHPGLFQTDDGSWMIIRFSAFYDALRHGQFPVRFLPQLNHGYGYPVADFLYPGFMYLGIPIHIIGFNFVATIKIILGVSLMSSGLFSFLWLKRRFTTIPALIGGLAYIYFPYHLWDVYHRGSVGEVLAAAVVPLILWQIERKSLIWTSISIGFLILAHNTIAVLFLPIVLFYMFFSKAFNVKQIILVLLISIGLSTFFWFPALYDLQYTVFPHTIVASAGQYFLQNTNYIGAFSLIIIILSILLLVKKRHTFVLFFISITIISLFFSFSLSSILWGPLLLNKLVQFPFRFLSITTLGISFLSAVILQNVSKKLQIIAAVIFVLMIAISSWKYISPATYTNYPDTYYSTNEDTTTVKNEYMPKWVTVIPQQGAINKVIAKNAMIANLVSNANEIQFTITSPIHTTAIVNTVYFPGWQVKIDGKKENISYHNQSGVIEFPVTQGTHTVSVAFTETPIRLFADVISIISLVGLILLLIKRKKQYEKNNS